MPGSHLSGSGNVRTCVCVWHKYSYMVILLFATTTRCLTACRWSLSKKQKVEIWRNKEKTRQKKNGQRGCESDRKKEDKKHRECVKCDIPQKIEWTEPGRSPGRSARFVWHLTSSSLYTELLTVMQRAQFYSNKARERERQREINRNSQRRREEDKETGRHNNISSRQNKRWAVTEFLSWCGKAPPTHHEKHHPVHTDVWEIPHS